MLEDARGAQYIRAEGQTDSECYRKVISNLYCAGICIADGIVRRVRRGRLSSTFIS